MPGSATSPKCKAAVWVSDKINDTKFSMSFSNLVEVLVGKKRFIKSIPFEKPFYKNIVKYVVDKFLNKIKYKNYMIDKNGLKTSNIQIDALK